MGSLTFLFFIDVPRRPSTLAEPTADPLPERFEDGREGTRNLCFPALPVPSGEAMLSRLTHLLVVVFPRVSSGHINKHLRLRHSQHLHHPLPSPGVLPLAGSISMETAVPQEGSAQEKASPSAVALSRRRLPGG